MSRMFSCLPIAPKTIVLTNKIKKTREDLRKIYEQHQNFNFAQDASTSTHQVNYDQRETSSDVDENRIVGRNEEKQEIIHQLCGSGREKETTVIPIYGLGGMGKTTLAGLVYNDWQVIKKYDHRIWIFVSEEFDLKKIGRSIISQMSIEGRQQSAGTLQSINMCLDDLFCGKKILIVLDDIWEEKEEELDKLKSMLNVGKPGNMIDVIVTTRKEDIAKKICTSRPYKLQPLQDDMCWNIIKTSSQFEYKSNKEQLGKIGLEIAKKCGGVPLAAQALGYMLKSKSLNGWSDVYNSDIWNESSHDDSSPHERVLLSLKLSYARMSPQLRLCFSYCAIFTKGHDIVEDDLIHQWIALGFVNTWSKGKEYMKQLLGISFLQLSKLPSVSREHAVRYTMHDLVHDLAKSVNGEELFVINASKNKNATSEQKYCRYASLINYEGQTKLSNILPNKVRAVHLFLDSRRLDLPVGSFSFAKCLRILDFSECSSILFPASIGKLKQLRCLIAPRMQNEKLPDCITEVSKLQYLNLGGSSLISMLPESFGKLGNLTHINFSGCSSISELPESFGDLKSMEHLDMLGCSGIRELPVSLGNLTCLQHLQLSKCCNVKAIPESLCGITNLQYLNLSDCRCLGSLPEDIGNLVNLQYLNISYCFQIRELPESFKKLQNLLHLDLINSRIEKGLPQAIRCLTALQHLDLSQNFWADLNKDDLPDAMRTLSNLKYLNLSNSMKALFSDATKSDKYLDFIGTLTNLEYLNLSFNGGFISLPETIGNLNKLRTLDLSSCTALKSLPESIGTLSLKSLLIEGCSDELIDQANSWLYSPTMPLFKVRGDDAGDRSNLHQVEGLNMAELRIFSLENVRYLEEARKVKLLDKQNLSDLSLAWTLDAGRFLEDNDLLGELVPPKGLKHLGLRGYIGTSFPSWLTAISHYLPNLVSISMCALPTSCNLPPLGQLPYLERLHLYYWPSLTKIDRDFCGGKGAFRRLSRVLMSKMEGLEEWNTTYCEEDGVEEFMFPMLDYLCILDCPRLRLKPCPPAFRECLIYGSDQVISSLEEVRNISHLKPSTPSTAFWIRGNNCQSLRLFHHFPALQQLEISECPNLTGLPESMRHLTSLQSLVLSWCKSITALPEWLAELSCLRRLKIMGCAGIQSLPPSIHNLTKLQKLKIEKNQQLIHWCEAEENRTKLAHITDKVYQYCD